MKLKCLIVVIAITFCTTIASKGFTYKYNGQNTGLDTLINIIGYYNVESPYGETLIRSVMFFKTGLVCYALGDNPEETFQLGKYTPESWGGYYLKNDTIIVQTITQYGLMQPQDITSYKYLILSRDRIILLPEHAINYDDIENNNDYIYNFHPIEYQIDPTNCWLLKKKWFWDKEAWNNRNQ